MRRWDLTSLPRDAAQPRVLFSEPEGRAVVIDLAEGQSLGDHQVRERAVVQVVSGAVRIEAGTEAAECGAGGQRGWRRQPGGGDAGSGGSARRVAGRGSRSESSGTAARRAWVYGCAGLERTSAVSPSSTIWPR